MSTGFVAKDKETIHNGSGYLDLTAAEAIEKAAAGTIEKTETENDRFYKLLKIIFYLCDVSGFHVEERLVLKDKQTGKIWR